MNATPTSPINGSPEAKPVVLACDAPETHFQRAIQDAFEWLCRRRRNASCHDDVWELRSGW